MTGPIDEGDAPPDDSPDGLDLASAFTRGMARARPPTRRRRRASAGGGRPGAEGRIRREGDGDVPPALRDGFSGSRPDGRDPQTLADQVTRLVSQQGWEPDLRVRSVFARWEELVGAQIASHCSPSGFADGRLAVDADSPAWATELRLLSGALIKRINTDLGDGTVLFIDVAGPGVSKAAARYRTTRTPKRRR